MEEMVRIVRAISVECETISDWPLLALYKDLKLDGSLAELQVLVRNSDHE